MSRYSVFLTFFVCIFIWPQLPPCTSAQNSVVHLNDDNWRDLMDNEWLVQFHAPWCPACRSLTKQWQTLASSSSQMGIQVAKIDVTENPSLSGRFFVTALPTIFHVINGEFRQYRGPRDSQTLEEFVVEKKWKNLETVPWYFYPDSYFMGAASYFFKLSHGLKDLNTYLLEQYSIPSWASYVLFAIVTILMGALIGLLFVCIVDFIFPPKHLQRKSFAQSSDAIVNSNEEIPEDDLVDLSSSEGDDEDSRKVQTTPPSSPSKKKSKENKKSSDSEPTNEDVLDDDETTKGDVRKRRARKAD